MAVSLTRSTSQLSKPFSHPAKAGWSFRSPSVIPGFGLTFGITLTYLSLIVLIPIAALFFKAFSLSPERIFAIATDQRTLRALWTS